MTLIKALLILSILPSFLVYFIYFRSQVFDRLLALGFFSVLIMFVLFPQLSNKIAFLVGVGRGADLFLYFFAVFTIFVLIVVYSRIERAQRAIIELVRYIALKDAQPASSSENVSGDSNQGK